MLGFFARRNTLSGSKKNMPSIRPRNSFYQLWIDAEMQYTCAYFNRPTDTLGMRDPEDGFGMPQARRNPGELVVEAGSDGAACLHMVRNTRVESRRSIFPRSKSRSRESAAALGIGSDRIEYVRDDYRNSPKPLKS